MDTSCKLNIFFKNNIYLNYITFFNSPFLFLYVHRGCGIKLGSHNHRSGRDGVSNEAIYQSRYRSRAIGKPSMCGSYYGAELVCLWPARISSSLLLLSWYLYAELPAATSWLCKFNNLWSGGKKEIRIMYSLTLQVLLWNPTVSVIPGHKEPNCTQIADAAKASKDVKTRHGKNVFVRWQFTRKNGSKRFVYSKL